MPRPWPGTIVLATAISRPHYQDTVPGFVPTIES
jgi:hypothetical protein